MHGTTDTLASIENITSLVVVKKGEAYTTSEIVANHAEIQHESIVRQIANNQADFESFGHLEFSDLKSEKRGRRRRVYKLNEQQATFLLALLDNTLPVKRFKRELVEQFYVMREKLQHLEAARRECRALTDAVMFTHENAKGYDFSNEQDLINRIALGQSAKEYRAAHGILAGENIRPYLTVQEIAAVQVLQNIDTGLIWAGLSYADRKAKLAEAFQKIQASKAGKPTEKMITKEAM